MGSVDSNGTLLTTCAVDPGGKYEWREATSERMPECWPNTSVRLGASRRTWATSICSASNDCRGARPKGTLVWCDQDEFIVALQAQATDRVEVHLPCSNEPDKSR